MQLDVAECSAPERHQQVHGISSSAEGENTYDRTHDADSDHANVSTVFTVMPQNSAYELVSKCIADCGDEDAGIDLNDPEQVSTLCDDSAFAEASDKIRIVIHSPRTRLGILMRPGMSEVARQRNGRGEANEDERKLAAILVRLLSILSLLLSAGKDAILLVPWPGGSTSSLQESPLLHDNLKHRLSFRRFCSAPWHAECDYEVASSSYDLLDRDSLEDVLTTAVASERSADSDSGTLPRPIAVGGSASCHPRG